jgi:hypothetical protein
LGGFAYAISHQSGKVFYPNKKHPKYFGNEDSHQYSKHEFGESIALFSEIESKAGYKKQ